MISVSEPGSTVLPGGSAFSSRQRPPLQTRVAALMAPSVSAPAMARVRTQARISASLPPWAVSTSTEVGVVAWPEPSEVHSAVPARCDSASPSPPEENTARSPVAWRLIEPECATLDTFAWPFTVASALSSASATTR